MGRRGRRRRRRRGKALAPSFLRILKTDPNYLALVIYKGTVISIRSLELALITNKVLNKFILFQYFINPLSQKALKGCINLIGNSVKGQFIIEFSRYWDVAFGGFLGNHKLCPPAGSVYDIRHGAIRKANSARRSASRPL